MKFFDWKKAFKELVSGMYFSKACQYRTIEQKNYKNLKYVSIKSTLIDLQKCITWLNRYGKGK
jgi:hypothetical protein